MPKLPQPVKPLELRFFLCAVSAADAQTRRGARGLERHPDPEQLQLGADGQAAGQSAKNDDVGDRVTGTPEPAVCPETVQTESDTPRISAWRVKKRRSQLWKSPIFQETANPS